jgi:hypothetical protein
MIRRTLTLVAVALSLSLTACDQAEKKAAEAKAMADKQAAEAKAAADKAAAEAKAAADKAAAEAAAKATELLATQKTEWAKKIDDGIEAMDRKLTFLKEKAAKLPAPAKAKATAALAAFDTAKATVVGLKEQLAALSDPNGLADLAAKVGTALADAQKSLDDAEASIMKKK